MRKILLILLITAISSITSYACSCIEKKESIRKKIKSSYVESDLIFIGKVLEKTILENELYSSSADPVIYKFELTQVYKGNIDKKTIEVVTSRDSASCGFPFQIGKNYIVYSIKSDFYTDRTGSNTDFITGLCRRNQELDHLRKKELRILTRLKNK
ncbi:hypothetical protein [Altibacter sp. HG106]|uniref:hypothetical protein n=1 Tax=Altibacter sp. HG106 TaxID=3023937 RepID=UPI00234FD49B|nr:hypothetical protein [Altibacter sp. HG106]MDC7996356.1 hypothetical protein [Altibacter sp. HG106]